MSGASFGLRKRLATGEALVFPWLGTPGPELAGQVIDMGDAAKQVAAINAVGKPAILRVRWNDPGIVNSALDMGAACVIAPMTNTVAQVQALVKAAKYPPVGQRSWGGYTMLQSAGVTAGEYLKQANRETLVMAMIETQDALDNLDAIAAVPGLDGLFEQRRKDRPTGRSNIERDEEGRGGLQEKRSHRSSLRRKC
jgi:4-hydroxy-2-oxoheptanedioate aldolase